MIRLEDKLKTNNLKITNPRKIIFSILNDSTKALSAKDVCDLMADTQKTSVDQASVYRNLNLFSQIGLVHRFQSGKYSVCQHQEDEEKHLHIVANCQSCGQTYEVESHSSGLCEISKKFKTFLKDFDSFTGITLQGVCLGCSGKAADS